MSLLLFREFGLFRFLIMNVFSERHRLHVFWPGLYFGHVFKISHLICGVGLSPFSHTYAASVVAAFLFWLRNVDV